MGALAAIAGIGPCASDYVAGVISQLLSNATSSVVSVLNRVDVFADNAATGDSSAVVDASVAGAS